MTAETGATPDEGHPDLPTTDIDVEAHIHFGMAGSFPLRLAEFFLVGDGLYIAEYSRITPLFGLATRQPGKDAAAMGAIYDRDGIDGVLLSADRVLWLNPDSIDRVTLHDGGWLGYPKITVYTADRQSYAYRVHGGERSFEGIAADLDDWADGVGVETEAVGGLGLSLRENVVRFFRHP